MELRVLAAALALTGAAALSVAQGDRQEPVEEPATRAPAEPVTESTSQERDGARCAKLEGELRSQCLRDVGAGTGANVPPKPAPPTAV